MSQLNQIHLETIAKILTAIASVQDDTARGIIACEDACIALMIGLKLHLTPSQIASQHIDLMGAMLSESQTEPYNN